MIWGYCNKTVKLNIEINKKFFAQLKPHAITVLIYSTAYYEKHNKVPSMKDMSTALRIGHNTIRKSLTEIFFFLNNESASHSILYNRYSFILPISERVSSTYTNYMSRNDDIEPIWGKVVEIAKDYYGESVKSYSKYYWRVSMRLKKLLSEIGIEKLQDYTDWYFRVKAPLMKYFNSAVFCHDNIIKDFKINHLKIKVKQIDIEKGYEKEPKEEEKRIFQKLIERRDAGTLDEYDEELLEYYKEQGWLNG